MPELWYPRSKCPPVCSTARFETYAARAHSAATSSNIDRFKCRGSWLRLLTAASSRGTRDGRLSGVLLPAVAPSPQQQSPLSPLWLPPPSSEDRDGRQCGSATHDTSASVRFSPYLLEEPDRTPRQHQKVC